MQVISADQAASLVQDGDTVLIGGSGGGHAVPERLLRALQSRFAETGHPAGLTAVHPVGLGNGADAGASRLAQEGLLKRVVCGTLIDAPAIAALAAQDKIEAFTLPQGALSLLIREMAGGRPGLLTHVGLNTFVDPRHEGGRQSRSGENDLVELVNLAGREWLFFKPFKVDVALLRATTADEDGNLSMEQEAIFGEMLSMAQATRRSGGIVIAQVRRLAKRSTLNPKTVKVPGMLVDAVIIDPDQRQTYLTEYSPAYAGELRIPVMPSPSAALDERQIIARRCALELEDGAVCNIGSGICTGIGRVCFDEEIVERIVLTNEQGLIGGAPAAGKDAGAAVNYWAMIDQPYQFDFYDGGGLDIAFLSAVEIDAQGNVNISRFADRIVGIGGFVNISQNAKKVVFAGTFTAGGLEVRTGDGRLELVREGRHRKFRADLQQLTYNADLGAENGQTIVYVTERAVFERRQDGLALTEIAPGVDLERDVLEKMEFRPAVATDLKLMDERVFRPGQMGLVDRIAKNPRAAHPRLAGLGQGFR